MKNIMEHYFCDNGKYYLYNYDKTIFHEELRNGSFGEWFNHTRNIYLEKILLNKISYKELFNIETIHVQYVLFFIKTNVIEDCYDFVKELIVFSAKSGVLLESVVDIMFYLIYNVNIDVRTIKRINQFVGFGFSHFKLYSYLMSGINKNNHEQYILDNCPNDVFMRLFTKCEFTLEEAKNKYSLLTL